MQRLRSLAPTNRLGVPAIEGLNDWPSTWGFMNRLRAGSIESAGEIVEAKTQYSAKLKHLRIAYEDYLDADYDAYMLKDGKRMAHERMVKEHELWMAQIAQAKLGIVVSPSNGEALEDKIRRAPTMQEKMNLASSSEDADKQAVFMAGYAEGSREMKEVENKYAVLKSRIIRGRVRCRGWC